MSSILIVDDEALVREVAGRMLAGGDYLILEARTAEAALDLLELTPDIHVVVADLHMPGHGGAWLVDQIRDRFPNVAVILATADDAVPGTLSLQPSVIRYLVKPIASTQLIAAVEEALAWHEQRVASGDRQGTADPFDSWINRKLAPPPRWSDDE